MEKNAKLTAVTIGEWQLPQAANTSMLLVWITAGIGITLPFALGTSPLDEVMLKVPHEEGNWWHALVGLPFFLSLPMIWLHLRAFRAAWVPKLSARRILWAVIIFSGGGTLLVEVPFLLHRAGTSELQRLEVIFSGLGIILVCGIVLYAGRKKLHPVRALLTGITAAYLANAFLCLIVYGESKFENQARSGWYLTLIIAVPILAELIGLLFAKSGRPEKSNGSF